MKVLVLLGILCGVNAFAATPLQKSCEATLAKHDYAQALDVVANNMGYATSELCRLPNLLDLFIERRNFVNQRNEIEPHIWITLHYNEYSCQYFVRSTDMIVTRKNCYNTF